MKTLKQLSIIALTAFGGVFLGNLQPAFALNWIWDYAAPGVEASGTFITNDIPDNLGFFTITDITGIRNDVAITGLHPTGTAIPGNEPFVLDNRISLAPEQFTSSGLGFSTADGNFVNLFYANFLNPPGFFEIYSAPPFITGFENFGPEDSELPVNFSSTIVPESTSIVSLLALGLFGVGSIAMGKVKQRS